MVLLKLRVERAELFRGRLWCFNIRELCEHQKCLWMADFGGRRLIGLCGPHIPKQVSHRSRDRLAWITEGIRKKLYFLCSWAPRTLRRERPRPKSATWLMGEDCHCSISLPYIIGCPQSPFLTNYLSGRTFQLEFYKSVYTIQTQVSLTSWSFTKRLA